LSPLSTTSQLITNLLSIYAKQVASWDWRTTRDGWEETLQVNVISTGLLAVLALPKLSATADIPGNDFKPHLVIVASEVHAWAKFPQQDAPSILAALNDKEKAIPKDIYNMSKLLDVLMTREIAQLPAAQKVNVNSLNPGLCKSELLRDIPWLFAT
jgi:retinol dehydrogenase-12